MTHSNPSQRGRFDGNLFTLHVWRRMRELDISWNDLAESLNSHPLTIQSYQLSYFAGMDEERIIKICSLLSLDYSSYFWGES